MALRKIKPQTGDRFGDVSPPTKNKEVFPRFRIELVHLPEAKKWDIGKEYHVLLKLKQTGISISRFQNDAEFDIIGIDPNPKHNSDHGSDHK